MCNVRSSSRRLSLKEQFYSLKLGEEKAISDHLQTINLLVAQLANLGVAILDKDLVDFILNNLPNSWSTFRLIQKGRERTPSFSELEGLFLQEQLGQNLETKREEEITLASNNRHLNRRSQHSRGRSSRGRGNTTIECSTSTLANSGTKQRDNG